MPREPVVHVIDDDDAVRESIAFLLDTASIATRIFDSPMAFLAALPAAYPACVVTDIRMPDMTGIDLLRRLRDLENRAPVIVITGHGDIALAVEAMKLGAVDFIEKPFDDEVLLAAVRGAIQKRGSGDDLAMQRETAAARLVLLSERERQVLDGLVAGHPNKTIAFDLGISPRTVEVYRANLMTKMQARSLSDLVRMALLTGGL